MLWTNSLTNTSRSDELNKNKKEPSCEEKLLLSLFSFHLLVVVRSVHRKTCCWTKAETVCLLLSAGCFKFDSPSFFLLFCCWIDVVRQRPVEINSNSLSNPRRRRRMSFPSFNSAAMTRNKNNTSICLPICPPTGIARIVALINAKETRQIYFPSGSIETSFNDARRYAKRKKTKVFLPVTPTGWLSIH